MMQYNPWKITQISAERGAYNVCTEEDEIGKLEKFVSGDAELLVSRVNHLQWKPMDSAPKNIKSLDMLAARNPKTLSGLKRVTDCYWDKRFKKWKCKNYDREGFNNLHGMTPVAWMLTTYKSEE